MLKKIVLMGTLVLLCPLFSNASVYDVNGDGAVTSADVTALYDYLLTGDNTYAATLDVDGDGAITSADITAIYNVLLMGEPLPERLVGGDISMLPRYEAAGAIYKDNNGNTISNILSYFGEQGWNAMRVRLFVNPENASAEDKAEGVCQDLAYVKALGKRIKDAGYVLVLDLHYSDTWADPSNQRVPAAWPSNDVEVLKDSVYNYTKHVLQEMIAAGARPDYIQTGNEITGGLLWPTGKTWNNIAAYLTRASQAVREVSPTTKIILHTELHRTSNGTGNIVADYFYEQAANYGLDYDIVGLSYYSAYHGDFAMLDEDLELIEAVSGDHPIMIMECGYGYAWELPDTKFNLASTYPYSDEGQKKFTVDMIAALKQHSRVKGLFWWWPEANEFNIPWQNQITTNWWNGSLFDNRTGQAQQALYELKQFVQ